MVSVDIDYQYAWMWVDGFVCQLLFMCVFTVGLIVYTSVCVYDVVHVCVCFTCVAVFADSSVALSPSMPVWMVMLHRDKSHFRVIVSISNRRSGTERIKLLD